MRPLIVATVPLAAGATVRTQPGVPVGPLGVFISYEVFFADRVREAVSAGGHSCSLPTNASSYAGDVVPAIEDAAARLRAASSAAPSCRAPRPALLR